MPRLLPGQRRAAYLVLELDVDGLCHDAQVGHVVADHVKVLVRLRLHHLNVERTAHRHVSACALRRPGHSRGPARRPTYGLTLLLVSNEVVVGHGKPVAIITTTACVRPSVQQLGRRKFGQGVFTAESEVKDDMG